MGPPHLDSPFVGRLNHAVLLAVLAQISPGGSLCGDQSSRKKPHVNCTSWQLFGRLVMCPSFFDPPQTVLPVIQYLQFSVMQGTLGKRSGSMFAFDWCYPACGPWLACPKTLPCLKAQLNRICMEGGHGSPWVHALILFQELAWGKSRVSRGHLWIWNAWVD